jgi:hypothetical protein
MAKDVGSNTIWNAFNGLLVARGTWNAPPSYMTFVLRPIPHNAGGTNVYPVRWTFEAMGEGGKNKYYVGKYPGVIEVFNEKGDAGDTRVTLWTGSTNIAQIPLSQNAKKFKCLEIVTSLGTIVAMVGTNVVHGTRTYFLTPGPGQWRTLAFDVSISTDGTLITNPNTYHLIQTTYSNSPTNAIFTGGNITAIYGIY